MSDLTSIRQKVQLEASRFRSAVSENLIQQIGSSINYLLDTQVTEFTANGSFTPGDGCTKVLLVGRGGSGGGGSGGQSGGSGGGGGGGCYLASKIITVVPNTAYAVTIGAAGTGGTWISGSSGVAGTVGGDTTFGALATFKGGGGGGGAIVQEIVGGVNLVLPYKSLGGLGRPSDGGHGGPAYYDSGLVIGESYAGQRGYNSPFANGGIGGTAGSNGTEKYGGGGGGGGGDGAGGAGGNGALNAVNGSPGTSGGGGGGGGNGGTTIGHGASGTAGILFVVCI